MKAARIMEPEKPLEISEVQTPKPTGSEVLVKVKAVGVCHSDLHLWEGGYDTGDGFMKVTDRGVKFPVIPGHEIVGTVTEIGSAVQGIAVGDNVLVYPWIGCGNCSACRIGNDNVCDAPRSLGVFQNGGYAEYALIPHFKFLAKVTGMDLEAAASLACSGLTAYNAIKKSGATSQSNVVIFGAGGLGLMGVQIARAITNANIIIVDIDDAKLQTAKELGADHSVNSKDPEATQKIMTLCGGKGADCVIDFVNAPPTVKMGLAIIRKRGTMTLVGLFGGAIELSLVSVPLKAITIQGAYTGNYNEMVELLNLAKRGVINPIISKRYSLSEANTALEDLKARKILGRAIINP
ncbi:MAG: zinc-binding alcohol dehydrogenase [Nitrososphaeria archaeon]|nr:zinc-binding alcohol dehydrogenase [Nitrososphaeria archaeon]NDB51880.1 zinc-binding alcohol dehydrogenase [Nitrosopumilaceae archaeon]NDB87351.1 zinc-binding alcohol dehydrogenase [Nitrososphaerota archaeon]NDB91550.1 zinc-binding alcohol dehydrogenase [Nitrososphaeria archaeon]NDF29166.1 zinc-binding alcohol dehydrogenase [Nitrososphaeria archaeon]